MKVDLEAHSVQITAYLTNGKPSRAAIEVTSTVKTAEGSTVEPKQIKVQRLLTASESELLELLLRSSQSEREI